MKYLLLVLCKVNKHHCIFIPKTMKLLMIKIVGFFVGSLQLVCKIIDEHDDELTKKSALLIHFQGL